MKSSSLLTRLALITLFILFCSSVVSASEKDASSPQIAFEGQIIYESADHNIWLINGNTGINRQLTTDATQNRFYFNPKFSPNGQQFAFCRYNATADQYALFVSSVTNYAPIQLATDAFCGYYEWSPDGSSIIYGKLVRADTSVNPWRWINPAGIWVVDVNSKINKELIKRTDNDPLAIPKWSPNGEWISYRKMNYIEGSGEVHTWRKTDQKRFLSPATGGTNWSPDSSTLVFDEINYVPRSGMSLYLTYPNTESNSRLLYSEPSYYTVAPTYSPNGEYIAFIRGIPEFNASATPKPWLQYRPQSNDTELFLIKPDGSGLIDTDYTATDIFDWSPSGKQLLYALRSEQSAQLLIYDLATSTTKTLVSNFGSSADWGVLPRTYEIWGRVADPSGQGITGVTISISKEHSTVSGELGVYSFDNLLAGTYTLTAQKGNYTFAPSVRTVTVPPDTYGQDFLGTDKPPIVFVHGWNGLSKGCEQVDPDDYFKVTDGLLRYAGYYVSYAYLLSAGCFTPQIQDNVIRLENAIALAKAATRQPKVILVAHSMGGIVARAYIEDPNEYAGDVSELFTFGSPHQGISLIVAGHLLDITSIGEDLTSIPELCGNQPGVCDMSEINMLIFNLRHHRPLQPSNIPIPYHLITGKAPLQSLNAKGIGMTALIPEPNDGLVSVASGTGLLDVEDKSVNDELHSLTFGDQYYFLRNGSWSHSYTECLEPVLVSKTRATCSTVHTLASTNPRLTDSSQPTIRTPIQTGIILPGQIFTRTIPVRNSYAFFVVKWRSGNLNVTLRDPAGQLTDPTYANIHPDLVQYQADNSIVTYSIAQPSSGTWSLIVKADSVPITGTTYTTFAAFNEPVQFSVGTDKRWYAPNSSVLITATLAPPPIQADVTATVAYSGGSALVKLAPMGGGLFQGTYVAPSAPGYVEIIGHTTGVDQHNALFDYGADTLIQFSSTKFQLAHTYGDSVTTPTFPPAKLFNDLNIAVNVNAAASGVIELSADLMDASGKFITNANLVQPVSTGSNSINLRFEGEQIYAAGADGPYQVKNVLLTDNGTITIFADSEENAYATGFYDYHLFKIPVVYLPIIAR